MSYQQYGQPGAPGQGWAQQPPPGPQGAAWGQPPPQNGAMGPPVAYPQGGAVAAAQVPPGYQPGANAPEYAKGHNGYPHPGEHFFTTKELITRFATVFVLGVILGGFIMFKLFPVIVRIVTAAAAGL